jgi:hypothetical protein
MSEDTNDVGGRLAELEARIAERKKAMQTNAALTGDLRGEWDDMMRQHAEIRRQLQLGLKDGSQAKARLVEDVDILRHSFFRWVARVDDHYKSR